MSIFPPAVSPELAAILATLAQHTPTPAQSQTLAETSQAPSEQRPREYEVEHATAVARNPTPQVEKPIINPATITEWSAGLRCVSKIAAQNQQFVESIKRMISNQRKHEMQWYACRQALKQEQARRGTGAGKIRDILKAVGGNVPAEEHKPETPAELVAELAAFDRKIYKAQLDMADSMSIEMKALGVPFFGTQPDLIRDEDEHSAMETMNESRAKWSPRITAQEHVELRSQMIRYLEDMYKD